MRSLLVLAALASPLSRPAWAEPVRELHNVWIPVSGGRRLAVRIWIPRTRASCRTGWASTSRVERGDWQTRVEAETVQTADERAFRVQTRLRAWENGALVFDRAWDQRVPRGL